MKILRELCSAMTAIAIAAVSTGAQAPVRAQQAGSAQVAIDNDDIGGVVTGPERAGSRRLGHRRDDRPADQVRPHRRHRRPGPLRHPRSAEGQLQGLGARLWPRRFAEGATASRARSLNLTAVIAPNEAAAAQYYPAIYWYSMMKIPDASQFGGKSEHPREDHAERLAQHDEEPQLHRLSSARASCRRARSPPRSASSSRRRRPGSAACSRASPPRTW